VDECKHLPGVLRPVGAARQLAVQPQLPGHRVGVVRVRLPVARGLHSAHLTAELEYLWDTSLTLELNLRTFGTH
jgi:hypothetical protein